MTLHVSTSSPVANLPLPPDWTACSTERPIPICCPTCGLVWGQLTHQTLALDENHIWVEDGDTLLEVKRQAAELLTYGRLETATCERCNRRLQFVLLWALIGEMGAGLEEVMGAFFDRQPLLTGAGVGLVQSPCGQRWLTQTTTYGVEHLRTWMSLPWTYRAPSSEEWQWVQEEAAVALSALVEQVTGAVDEQERRPLPATQGLFLQPLGAPEWPVLIRTFGEWPPDADMHVEADADFDEAALADRIDWQQGVFVEVRTQDNTGTAFGFGGDVPAAYRAAVALLGFDGLPELLDETLNRLNVVLAPFGAVLSQEGSGRAMTLREDWLWMEVHPLLTHEPGDTLLEGMLNLSKLPGGQKVAPGQTQLTPPGLHVDVSGRRLHTRAGWSVPCWCDDREQIRPMIDSARPKPLVHKQLQTDWLDLSAVVWVQTHERPRRAHPSTFWERFDVANSVLVEAGLKIRPSLAEPIVVDVLTQTDLQIAQGFLTAEGTVQLHLAQPLLELDAHDERPVLNAGGVAAVLGQWPGSAHVVSLAGASSHPDEPEQAQDRAWRTVRLWDANELLRCRLFVGVRTTLPPDALQAVIAEVQWLSDGLTRPAGLAVGLSAVDVAELLGTWAGCEPIIALDVPEVDQEVELWGLRSLVNPQEWRLTRPGIRAAVLERHLKRAQTAIESGCAPEVLTRTVEQVKLLRALIDAEEPQDRPSAVEVSQLPAQVQVAAVRPLQGNNRRRRDLRGWWQSLRGR